MTRARSKGATVARRHFGATSRVCVAAGVAASAAACLAACLAACQWALPFDGYDRASVGDDAGGAGEAGPPCALASGRMQPAEVVVDDTYAYWVEFTAEGGVYRVDKHCTGAAVETLASSFPYPADLAVDDASVYWVNESPFVGARGGSVMRVDKAGGTPAVLATQVSLPNRIVLDDERAYFTEAVATGTVSSVPKDGSGPAVVNVSNLVNPGGLALDDAHLYITTSGDDATSATNDGVWLAPKSCPDPSHCATAIVDSVTNPFVLRLDSGRLFFSQHVEGSTMPGSVFFVAASAAAGTTPTELTATHFTAERLGIAVDGLDVFVAATITPGAVSEDVVQLDVDDKVSSQQSRTVADGIASPQGITVDESFVYYTTFGSGGVWRAPR